jgi:hypothetical protein
MFKITSIIPVFSTTFVLFFTKLLLGQLSAEAQVCYIYTDDGLIRDMSALCRDESTPITTISEQEQKQVDYLNSQLQKNCSQLPNRCETETELMGEVNKICSRPGSCPNSVNQALQNYKRRQNTQINK